MSIYKYYNIDVVGAKTGKKLTKKEKAINYSVNLLAVIFTTLLALAILVIVSILVINLMEFLYEKYPLVYCLIVLIIFYRAIKK